MIFDLDNTSTEQWEAFRSTIDDDLDERQMESLLNSGPKDITWMNRTWDVFESVIKDAMKLHITSRYIQKIDKIDGIKFNTPMRKLNKTLKKLKRFKKDKLKVWHNELTTKLLEQLSDMNDKWKDIDITILISRIRDESIFSKNINVNLLNRILFKLRKKIYIEEDYLTSKQIENAIINRDQHFANNDKKIFLDSVLERERRKIKIDRLKVIDDNVVKLVLDDQKIKDITMTHFRDITNSIKVHSLDNDKTKEWENEYRPLEFIDETIYKGLLEDIDDDEWWSTINSLPLNKAGGISKITYDILKKLSNSSLKLLKKFYNIILKTSLIPNSWLLAIIYPIPKPGDWDLDLNKTRPITLLESPQKLLMKILTNRLSRILATNKEVLGECNYAALPGYSTNEPIFITNNILEDARSNNKELWMCLQDMSKAYDLVNRKHLIMALKRIKIPDRFIDIIMNSLEGRKNRIITDVGITNEYQMVNGIDQGAIMSPLLWIIYYNPLFHKINKIKEIGYKMTVEWEKDLNNPRKRGYLECICNNVVYMDDTTWFGKNKKDLNEQLRLADEFNRFNGIKVNPAKSVLLVINSKTPKEERFIQYGKDTTKIWAIDENESTRFLGVWISPRNNKRFVANQIKKDIDVVFMTTRNKRMTADQAAYVANMVILPRIEYKSKITVFNEDECKKLTAKVRKLVRNKMNATNTIPNVLLENKEVTNLLDFYKRQMENQVNNLMVNINNKGLLGKTTEISVRTLQKNEWMPDNPLSMWHYNNPTCFKDCWLAQVLCLMNNLAISIGSTIQGDYKIEGGYTPLYYVLQDEYRKNKNSLKKKRIMYLEQVLYKDLTVIEWKNLGLKRNKKFKGKTPYWWEYTKSKIVDKIKDRTLKERIIEEIKIEEIDNINKKLIESKPDGRKVTWIAAYKNNERIFGRTKYTVSNSSEQYIEAEHFWEGNGKKGSLKIRSCIPHLCNRGNIRNGKCFIKVEVSKTLRIKGRIKIRNERNVEYVKIFQNRNNIYKELEIHKNSFIDTPIDEQILINSISIGDERNIYVKNILDTSLDYKVKELLDIYDVNSRQYIENTYYFFTDGSYDPERNKMGLGWIQTSDETGATFVNRFAASNIHWVSSTKAELLAILTAILVVKNNSRIIIYTDSKCAIDQINKYKVETSTRRRLKFIHYQILDRITDAIKKFNLDLVLIKVKAHDENPGNEVADLLAKEGLDQLNIKISNRNPVTTYNLFYHGELIEHNCRKFVRIINKEMNNLKENELKRIAAWPTDTNKKCSFEWMNDALDKQQNSTKKGKEDTNKEIINFNKLKNFKFKMLMNELPTMEKLKTRRPDLYKADNLCPRCRLQKETKTHLWNCSKANLAIIELQYKVNNLFKDKCTQNDDFIKGDELMSKIYKYTKTVAFLKDLHNENRVKDYINKGYKDLEKTYVWDGNGSLDDLINGYIRGNLIDTLTSYHKSKSLKKVIRIIKDIMNEITIFVYRNIWVKRNDQMMEFEKDVLGIDRLLKKKHNRKEKRKSVSERNKIRISGKKAIYGYEYNEQLVEIIFDRIKGGYRYKGFPLGHDIKILKYGTYFFLFGIVIKC